MIATKHHFLIVAGTPFIAALVATRPRTFLASLTTFGLTLAGAASAFAVPPNFQGTTDALFAVDRPSNTDLTPAKPTQAWNGVPAYLLRKDGTLIKGLRPTNPDEQG